MSKFRILRRQNH